jgi:inner membrane protein
MMTLQGVPLFYPFKKNPCVIPGNPAFRFRSSDIKTEFILMAVFIALGFSCSNLFKYGFWNNYNRQFNTIKHIHAESMIYEKALQVQYQITQNGQPKQGEAWLMEATTETLLLFEEGKGYTTITKADKLHLLHPIRTERIMQLNEMRFTGITMDSLQKVLYNKPIQTLKLQCALPVQYTKDNKPQSGTTVELENVYNPILISHDIDSIDATVEKDINLLQLEIAKAKQEQKIYILEKQTLEQQLKTAELEISSTDLATKEHATSDITKLKNAIHNLKPPYNNLQALQTRLEFLQEQLYVRKMQSINGYISYRLLR